MRHRMSLCPHEDRLCFRNYGLRGTRDRVINAIGNTLKNATHRVTDGRTSLWQEERE